MYVVYALSLFHGNSVSRFAREGVDEEAAAHADLSMNAPDGQVNSAGLERLAPREHVMIDAVDERPIKIEKKRLSGHSSAFSISHILGLATKGTKCTQNTNHLS